MSKQLDLEAATAARIEAENTFDRAEEALADCKAIWREARAALMAARVDRAKARAAEREARRADR